VIAAAIIVTAEGTASAIAGPGQRRHAYAMPTARNGSVGIRKRGPGEPPPIGSQ